MKRSKLNLILVITILATALNAQDTTAKKKKMKIIPERRQEIGVSILSPLIVLTGNSDSDIERFTNVTYRYRFTDRHSIRGSVGFNRSYHRSSDPLGVVASPQNTVYLNTNTSNPTNYQVCLGYERMFGRRLKQVIGVDLLYNNRFVDVKYEYTEAYEQTDPNGGKHTSYRLIDTGAYRPYHKTYNYYKFGINASYSIRYEVSKRFVLTASAIGSFKYYNRKEDNHLLSNFDFSMPGLIADISVYYRFK